MIFIIKRENIMDIIFLFIISFVLLFYREIRDNMEAMIKDILICIATLIAYIIKVIRKIRGW